jgi:hypothetical protein
MMNDVNWSLRYVDTAGLNTSDRIHGYERMQIVVLEEIGDTLA